MPIEFIAVQCFKPNCHLFQVVQRRKDNKWQCRVCQEKQSILKTYAISYKASDIRGVVQRYNMLREKENDDIVPIEEPPTDTIKESIIENELLERSSFSKELDIEQGSSNEAIIQVNFPKEEGKWSRWVDKTELLEFYGLQRKGRIAMKLRMMRKILAICLV